jgi:DNA invertase Pin-like site-specific DNA recombinase
VIIRKIQVHKERIKLLKKLCDQIKEENILVEVGSAANEIKNRPIFQKLINQKLQVKCLDKPDAIVPGSGKP